MEARKPRMDDQRFGLLLLTPATLSIFDEMAAGPAPPAGIRALVGAEAVRDERTSFTERLMFWQGKPVPGAVVDAAAEEARLQKDAALGESPTTGETPVIDRGKSKFLGIF